MTFMRSVFHRTSRAHYTSRTPHPFPASPPCSSPADQPLPPNGVLLAAENGMGCLGRGLECRCRRSVVASLLSFGPS